MTSLGEIAKIVIISYANEIKRWKIACRLILMHRIWLWRLNFQNFKIHPPLWRHIPNFGQNLGEMGKILIISYANGIKRWKFACGIILIPRIRLWRLNFQIFKIHPLLWRHIPNLSQNLGEMRKILIISYANGIKRWKFACRLILMGKLGYED